MSLATLDQVKAKLQIPLADNSDDAAIQAVLEAAERYILNRTGFTLTAEAVEEVIRREQAGRSILLRYRPVSNVTASARPLNSDSWFSMAIDVVDASTGLVIPNLSRLFHLGPLWASWYASDWDILRINYTTVPLNPIPVDLADATAALAAYWYLQQLAGPAASVGVGQVRETYSQDPIPSEVELLLVPYTRGSVGWC